MQRMLRKSIFKASGEFKMKKFPLGKTMVAPTGHTEEKGKLKDLEWHCLYFDNL